MLIYARQTKAQKNIMTQYESMKDMHTHQVERKPSERKHEIRKNNYKTEKGNNTGRLQGVRQGHAFGISTSYRLDGPGLNPGKGKRFFSSPYRPDRSPPSFQSKRYQGSFLRKRTPHKVEHSFPFSADVQTLSLYAFMA